MKNEQLELKRMKRFQAMKLFISNHNFLVYSLLTFLSGFVLISLFVISFILMGQF